MILSWISACGSVTRPPIEFGAAALSDGQHNTDIVRDGKYNSTRVFNGTTVAGRDEQSVGSKDFHPHSKRTKGVSSVTF